MEYQRKTGNTVAPLERIKNFKEFHLQLPKKEQQMQAARCMACGVPFCQAGTMIAGMASGCPLQNLVPEWNDLVYLGNYEQAYRRLTKTNCFPEFTSRVCPALCEAACTCNVNGDPVCTKENERAIIENAWATGLITPQPPKVRTGKRVAVVGSGPSGLAAAMQLNRRGHSVTVFERRDRVGGLLRYGIPNMKLDKSVIDRRVDLMKAEGIEFVTNADIGKDVKADKLLKEFDRVLLCCGAANPRDIKADQRAENNPWPEWPKICKTDYGQEEAIAVFGHDPRIYQTTVTEFIKNKKGEVCQIKTVKLTPKKDEKSGRMMMVPVEGTEEILPADLVLIAAGFLGSQKYVTDAFKVEVNQRTNVKTDDGKYQTTKENVFTAGDMHRGQSLVVWAIREGREAAKAVDESLMGYTNL